MKGKVFNYGDRGDPLIRADSGRIIIIKDCKKKVPIGSEVEYVIFTDVNKTSFAYLSDDSLFNQSKKPEKASCITLERIISGMLNLWNNKFRQHMGSGNEFDEDLYYILGACHKDDYDSALKAVE